MSSSHQSIGLPLKTLLHCSIWLQAMNRQQQRLDLVLIPLDNFCEAYSSSASSPTGDHSWKSPISRTISPLQVSTPLSPLVSVNYSNVSFESKVIYSETSTSWINVHDLLNFIEITDSTVTFIWASEETGFRHLYLVTSSLNGATNGCRDTHLMNQDIDYIDETTLIPRIVNKVVNWCNNSFP